MISKIVFALLLTSGTVQASDWVSVGKATQKSGEAEFFVDTSSIRATGANRRAWVKMVFGPNAQRGFGEDAKKWQSYSVIRFAFDCDAETSRTEATTIYFTDGTNHTDSAALYPTAWEPVVPDTFLSTFMQFICGWKPK
jgi:hypothetical protein